jgi:hypothetical protein
MNLLLLRRAGLLQLRMNRPRDAIPFLERALAIEPDDEETGRKLAEAREILEP